MGQPTERANVVSHWTTGYNYWQAKLAGDKTAEMYPDNPCRGFWRRGVREQKPSGQWHRVGWEPVAIFESDGALIGRVGSESTGQDVTGPDLLKLWEYCGGNAITEDMYRTVARHGKPWPDAHDPAKNKPAEPAPSLSQDGETGKPLSSADVTESPEQKLAREIAEAKAGVSQYDKIESDEMAARAGSLKNELTTLAGKMDKVRDALARPHIDAQAEINGRLNPLIKSAHAECQKLLANMGLWEDFKREAARKAQAETDRKLAEHAKAVLDAKAKNAPPPPDPVHVAPNAPAPVSQIIPAVGRKLTPKISKFVTSIDLDKAFAQFRNEPAVNACLIALAQRAVDAGLTVDGAVVEERSVVR